MMKRLVFFVCPVLIAMQCVAIDESKFAWTIDDVLAAEGAMNWEISPDNQWVIWAKYGLSQEKDTYAKTLFLSSLTDDERVQLNKGNEGFSSPKWSPDGQLIAFLSSRPNPKAKSADHPGNQVWLQNPFEGEPWPLTFGEREVNAFKWAGSNSILYLMEEAPSSDGETERAKKDSAIVVEDDAHQLPVRLFSVEVSSAKVRRVMENTDRIVNLWVSPDGTHVLTGHDRNLRNFYDQSAKPMIFLTDLKSGEFKEIFSEAQYHFLAPATGSSPFRWQRDSRGFYASNATTSNPRYSYPAIIELYHYDIATGQIEKVHLDWENGLQSADVHVTGQGFITLLAGGVRTKPAHYVRDAGEWRRQWVTGIHTTNIIDCFTIGSDDKTLIYGHSTPVRPIQFYRATLNQNAQIESPVQITSLSPRLEKKPMAQYEIVHWKGARDEMVEGLLHYPLDYEPGKKYPLVVELHGGPADLFQECWNSPLHNNHLWNARGAFVFQPNYHGSTGYGLKWVESNIGRLGELEVEDVNTGVDYLIQRGLVDSDRMAVRGWSNGGSLTAAVTVSTNRYKAAIAGSALIDLVDYWAGSDIGAWYCGTYFGKTPLDDPATLMRYSPFYQLNKVTTPTLILFGANDRRVPVGQGWRYYRALQQSGKADVRFILLPGEGHGLARLSHMKRALDEELAWFDKYLFRSPRGAGRQ